MSKQPAIVRHWLADWSVTILMLLFGTTTLVQAFVVPTPSMDSTILVGDHLFVDKLAYAPAGDLSRHLLPYSDVHRGDIIVFRYPVKIEANYVKRVIGVPGDRIHFEDDRLFLNGQPVAEPYVQHVAGGHIPYLRSFPREQPPFPIYDRGVAMLRDHVHDGDLLVPEGMYFALGDNRDNSEDSRFWGLVPRENIVGKPLFVWWSYDAPLHHWQPRNAADVVEHAQDMALHFFSKTRWNKMFRRIPSYPLDSSTHP